MIDWTGLFGRRKQQKKEYQDKEEPPEPTRIALARIAQTQESDTAPLIRSRLRNSPKVVSGARAMNVQVPPRLRRKTDDWDIICQRAKRRADEIEDELDELYGKDVFYVEALPLTLEEGVVYRVKSKATDEALLDFKNPVLGEGLPDFIVKENIKYEALKELRRKKVETLKNPKARHRWAKDRQDLRRINQALRETENIEMRR